MESPSLPPWDGGHVSDLTPRHERSSALQGEAPFRKNSVVPVQPVASELYYEYRDTNGKPSEYTLVIGYINGLHYTATKRISGTLSCAGDGHRKFDSVAFDWDQAAVQDEFAADARKKPTLQLLHDLKWYAYATSADGDCMPDSLAACSRRTEFLFRRHGRTWPQDFPMTAAAWRTCLGQYIQDNAAAFTINTNWTVKTVKKWFDFNEKTSRQCSN